MTTPNTPMTEQDRVGLADTLKYIADAIERDGSYAPAGPEFVIRELRAASEHFALTEADREEMDMAIHRWKQSGGPARANQERAEKLEAPWAAADRLGGRL